MSYRYRENDYDASSVSGGQTPAQIGGIRGLKFKEAFAQPTVDLQLGKQTTTHETLGEESITQVFGRKADRVSLQGVVTAEQLGSVRALNLPSSGPHSVRTEEWSGTATIKSIDITQRREKYEGEWLYDVAIEMVENEGAL
jgi:hypothetical protein